MLIVISIHSNKELEMKRYTEKQSTAQDYLFEDESDGFTISFSTFLTVLLAATLGAIVWSALSFDPEGLAEKGLSLLDVPPNTSILIGLLPFALGFTILFTRFAPEYYKTTSFLETLLFSAVFTSASFLVFFIGLLSVAGIQTAQFSDQITETRISILEEQGYDNIKEISNEEYEFTADKDGKSMRIDFVVEDDELFIQESNNISVTPVK